MSKNILFVVPYPTGKAPSQRFRFEQYFKFLIASGYTFKVSSFMDLHTWSILYKQGHTFTKILGTIKGFLRRILLLFSVPRYDYVFVHRESTPIGPPWFEWIVVHVFRKSIIYDFDDAIWVPNTSENNKIVAGIKWHGKVKSICKWAYKISCGNTFLQEFALQFNKSAFVIPTTIDTFNHHNQTKQQEDTPVVVIGWTGTHSTMKYLSPLVPVLQELEKHYNFVFMVISNKPPEFSLHSLQYKAWNADTEIMDLLNFNIGVMPLIEDQWAKGKCAFKALQYMSLGIPALVSPVGMNVEVVDNGINGYICHNTNDWLIFLEKLINDHDLRMKLGGEARKKVENNYSVHSNKQKFLKLFDII